jgi:hypothetical protein
VIPESYRHYRKIFGITVLQAFALLVFFRRASTRGQLQHCPAVDHGFIVVVVVVVVVDVDLGFIVDVVDLGFAVTAFGRHLSGGDVEGKAALFMR